MSGESTRRDFLRIAGLTAVEAALFSVGLGQASATSPSSQPSQSVNLPEQKISRPDSISIPTTGKSLSLDFKNPKFDSLSAIGMDDAKSVTTEWDKYTTQIGLDTPYKSKVYVYQKIFKPTGVDPTKVDELIEYQVLLDFVSRKKVLNCETIEFFYDTKNKRTTRDDNGLENTTTYGHPTHWHWIVSIRNDRLRYHAPITARIHPISKCWQKGDYKRMWQEIPIRQGGKYQAVSWLDSSPNESKKHWIAAFRFLDKEYRNPDRLEEIPTVITMGHLPRGVTAINDPYMDGHWIEALRHPKYTPPFTPRAQENDVRSWASVTQRYN